MTWLKLTAFSDAFGFSVLSMGSVVKRLGPSSGEGRLRSTRPFRLMQFRTLSPFILSPTLPPPQTAVPVKREGEIFVRINADAGKFPAQNLDVSCPCRHSCSAMTNASKRVKVRMSSDPHPSHGPPNSVVETSSVAEISSAHEISHLTEVPVCPSASNTDAPPVEAQTVCVCGRR